jgi:hypothetical protein
MSKETGNKNANGIHEKHHLENRVPVCSGEKELVHKASSVVRSPEYFCIPSSGVQVKFGFVCSGQFRSLSP